MNIRYVVKLTEQEREELKLLIATTKTPELGLQLRLDRWRWDRHSGAAECAVEIGQVPSQPLDARAQNGRDGGLRTGIRRRGSAGQVRV